MLQEWSKSTYKILAAGRKARKTTFIVNELFINAMTDERGLTYPIIGPTRVQEKEIVWDDHVSHVLRILNACGVPYEVNKTELSVRFPHYGKFVVDGSDNIESLRGKSDWGGVGLDEFAFWNSPQYAWEQVVEPNLLVNNAFAIMASTTNGYDYFHRQMKRGDILNEVEGTAFDDDNRIIEPTENYLSYRFTSYDNPSLSRKWLDAKRATMSEEGFNREYMARFEKFRGLIYKEFDRRIHVLPSVDVHMGWQIYRCMDFGAVNPTVCLWIAVDNSDNVYIFDEYHNTGQTAEAHANIIKANTNGNIIATFGDPSAQQEILDYASHGVLIVPATRIFDNKEQNWVRSGIEKIRQALKINAQTGRPRLYVAQKCVNTIREFESYHWLETKSSMIIKDQPEKKDDHCMDALRYFFESYTPPQVDWNIPSTPQTNRHTGYSMIV